MPWLGSQPEQSPPCHPRAVPGAFQQFVPVMGFCKGQRIAAAALAPANAPSQRCHGVCDRCDCRVAARNWQCDHSLVLDGCCVAPGTQGTGRHASLKQKERNEARDGHHEMQETSRRWREHTGVRTPAADCFRRCMQEACVKVQGGSQGRAAGGATRRACHSTVPTLKTFAGPMQPPGPVPGPTHTLDVAAHPPTPPH